MSIAVWYCYCSRNTDRNGLIGTIPSEMGLLTSLQSLYLSKQCRFCVWCSRSETTGGVPHDAFPGGSRLDSTRLRSHATKRMYTALLHCHCSWNTGNNALTGTVPSEIKGLPELRCLRLRGEHCRVVALRVCCVACKAASVVLGRSAVSSRGFLFFSLTTTVAAACCDLVWQKTLWTANGTSAGSCNCFDPTQQSAPRLYRVFL